MAIAYVDSRGAINGTSATALAVAKPSIADGHHLLAVLGLLSTTATITDPASLAAAILATQSDGTNVRGRVYSKTADGEPAASYDWAFSSAVKQAGWVGGYSGVDTGSPVHDWATSAAGASGTSFGTPACDVPDQGWLVYGAVTRHAPGAVGVSSWTSSDGGTLRYQAASNAGSADITICVWDSGPLAAASGVTRTLTSTLTESRAVLFAVALTAASGAPASVSWAIGAAPI